MFPRNLSEEFLAMPFVSGPEGVVFREDKPALLRFYLGLAEDFLSEDSTEPQVDFHVHSEITSPAILMQCIKDTC